MFRLQSPVISRTKKHILNEKRHLTDANIEIYLKVDLTDKEFKAAIIKKKKKKLQQLHTVLLKQMQTIENLAK